MGGITNTNDTLVTCADFIGLTPAAEFFKENAYPDTTNILQLPAYDHSTLCCYQDTAKGWFVKQYNLSVQDYSYGVIVYEIKYNGKHGALNQVYSGVKFDFDVPGLNDWPTGRDDELIRNSDGFAINDYYTGEGMEVQTLTANTLFNYWRREDSPRTLPQIYEALLTENSAAPQDTADYHFLMSSGPFVLNNGEVILLAFVIQPVGSGFSKISDCLTALQEGVNNFQKNKNLAKIDRSKPNKINNTDIPSEFLLSANYPNPFNPLTQIEFGLPEKAQVKLEIFNSLGQKIKNRLITNGWMPELIPLTGMRPMRIITGLLPGFTFTGLPAKNSANRKKWYSSDNLRGETRK